MGNARNFAFWIVLFLLILGLFRLFSDGQTMASSNEVAYSEFIEQVDSGNVAMADVDGETVRYRGSDGKDYFVIVPGNEEVVAAVLDRMLDKGVEVAAEPQAQSGFFSLLSLLLPVLILIGFWFFMMNRMQGGGKGGAMGFGSPRPRC